MAQLGARAKAASRALATASTAAKDAALLAAADLLVARSEAILEANGRDVAREEAAGMAPALLDRLRLSAARIEGTDTEADDPGDNAYRIAASADARTCSRARA